SQGSGGRLLAAQHPLERLAQDADRLRPNTNHGNVAAVPRLVGLAQPDAQPGGGLCYAHGRVVERLAGVMATPLGAPPAVFGFSLPHKPSLVFSCPPNNHTVASVGLPSRFCARIRKREERIGHMGKRKRTTTGTLDAPPGLVRLQAEGKIGRPLT